LRGEDHSAAGWGRGGVCRAEDCRYKVHSFGQWAAE